MFARALGRRNRRKSTTRHSGSGTRWRSCSAPGRERCRSLAWRRSSRTLARGALGPQQPHGTGSCKRSCTPLITRPTRRAPEPCSRLWSRLRSYVLATVALVQLAVVLRWKVDVDAYGGWSELAQEGLGSSFALFLVRPQALPMFASRTTAPGSNMRGRARVMLQLVWIAVYTTVQF